MSESTLPTALPKSPVFICPPPNPRRISVKRTVLCVGFGVVIVTRDDEVVWLGDDKRVYLYRFELYARREPGVWRVRFHGPLVSALYERMGPNDWRLTERGDGFA